MCFVGCYISGVSTNVIARPEGDMLDYINSLKRLQTLEISVIVPAHGPIVNDPQARIAEYIAHRLLREQQILQVLVLLGQGLTIQQMVQYIYQDVDSQLHPIAALSVEAHLIKLEKEQIVVHHDEIWSLL